MPTRRPIGFFDLTEEDLSPEHLNATVDAIMATLAERTHRGFDMDAFTDARVLGLINGAPTANVWRSLPIDPDALASVRFAEIACPKGRTCFGSIAVTGAAGGRGTTGTTGSRRCG